jgi:hypothetical protein
MAGIGADWLLAVDASSNVSAPALYFAIRLKGDTRPLPNSSRTTCDPRRLRIQPWGQMVNGQSALTLPAVYLRRTEELFDDY